MSGRFPTTFQLPKVNSFTEKSDYRPISILSVLKKAFEHVMFEQKTDCVTRNNFTTPFQSGFQPGHSTMTDFVRVSDDIRLSWELNQSTILVLLDFIKAFDSVCHGLFIIKLRRRYGFYASMAALI
jgi:hypothetical protein